MNTILNNFLKLKISLTQLKKELGNNLYNITVKKPEKVCAKDVIFLINQYVTRQISLQNVIDWVNVIWFTDLYEYNSLEENSIASVMSLLETLDEEGTQISNKEFADMIDCLSSNKVYESF